MLHRSRVWPVLLVGWLAGMPVASGCQSAHADAGVRATARGTLLLIGGGLDDDGGAVYERLLELAAAPGAPHIVIATAATGPEDVEATDKTEALRTWSPAVTIEVVRRATPTADTVAAIDRATAMFFTGGDQKRITDRYRPGDADTPEWSAMQRLLARGGVIAGASAGDAMMGEVMFLSGTSARALGIAGRGDEAGDGAPRLGPQLGPGMRFLPSAITDSHFFERDRLGRLVAGLEASGRRFGIGVGEDACVEVDLASGTLVGLTGSESLLVDAAFGRRDGSHRRGFVARVLRRGDRLSLDAWSAGRRAPPDVPSAPVVDVPVVEPGQNRQLASWRLFRQASVPGSGVRRLRLDGFCVLACPAGDGDVVFELRVPE